MLWSYSFRFRVLGGIDKERMESIYLSEADRSFWEYKLSGIVVVRHTRPLEIHGTH